MACPFTGAHHPPNNGPLFSSTSPFRRGNVSTRRCIDTQTHRHTFRCDCTVSGEGEWICEDTCAQQEGPFTTSMRCQLNDLSGDLNRESENQTQPGSAPAQYSPVFSRNFPTLSPCSTVVPAQNENPAGIKSTAMFWRNPFMSYSFGILP